MSRIVLLLSESDETPSLLASAQYVGVTRGGMDGGRPVAHMSGTLGCPSSLKQGARNRRCCVLVQTITQTNYWT